MRAEYNVGISAGPIVTAWSESSKYFGPGLDTATGVVLNIINDFSYI